jgi:hypothetical protein
MRTSRYHVRLGDRRTTVSLDKTLSAYLALHLRVRPQTPKAHQAIRRWLQQRLDVSRDPGRHAVSQWLQAEALEAVVDKNLSAAYGQWLLEDLSPTRPDQLPPEDLA